MEDKKFFFEPFCKASLIIGNKKEKEFLKPLSAVKEICQASSLFVNKAVKFTEAFRYAITLKIYTFITYKVLKLKQNFQKKIK